MNKEEYKKEISAVLQCDQNKIFLYWKGRVALYAILKSLNLEIGDEVIIPAFTCVVVPNAIFYAGLKPVYVDISSTTLNMEVGSIENKITNRTKVIICQNTFGLSSDIEEILVLAKKYNLITIEDCTHGFGGFYNGKPNGSYCDAAFFSTQWNKPFSTGIGGFLLVNNENILSRLMKLESSKVSPALGEKYILKSLIYFKKYIINKYTQWPLTRLYRLLSTKNLILGSNQGEELTSQIIPQNYFKDISNIQINAGIKSIKKINSLNRLRKENAARYTEFLLLNKKNYVNPDFFPNHMFLKYPLIVKNRCIFFDLALKSNVTLGDWFLSPLHPIKSGFEKWDLIKSEYPIASVISEKIVNLPTDLWDISQVLKFLEKELHHIE